MKKFLLLISLTIQTYLNAGSCAVSMDNTITLPTVAGIETTSDLVFNDIYGNINCDNGLEVTITLIIENAKISNTENNIDEGVYSVAINSDYFKVDNTNLTKISSNWDKDPAVYNDAVLTETWSYVGQGEAENILLRVKNSGISTCSKSLYLNGKNCPSGNAQSNVQMRLSW